MALSRRSMFGVAAGAAAAAPTLGEQAWQTLNKTAHPPAPADYMSEAKQAQWEAEQFAKFKRHAAGDFSDEDRLNHPTEGPPTPFRALRSVSEDAKVFLRNRRYDRQWQERAIKTALDALDHYDKTGILRTFF